MKMRRMKGRLFLLVFMSFVFSAAMAPLNLSAQKSQACRTIHGRANLFSGDGQLRIWHVGTHHEFQPDRESWPRVEGCLAAGVKEPQRSTVAIPSSTMYLFGDFLLCPTEPFREGAVQTARVQKVTHRIYVPVR